MIDFNKIKTIPIRERKNKAFIKDFIRPENNITIIDNENLRILGSKIIEAKKKNKQIIFMMGAHIVKVGCSPLIIDLMKRNIITHLAINGAFSIHDFEIAMIGQTSEYVENNLENGSFGMSEETGKMMNQAIQMGASENIGWGKAIGKLIAEKDFMFKEESVLYHAYKLGIPVSVHTTVGAEIIYQHPSCDGSAMGKTSYQDFKLFADTLSKAGDGVIVNVGSAVVMPEVFLKALTIVRNLGHNLNKITTANLDMLEHYRPKFNILERPTAFGGLGLQVTEKHEKTIPSLHKIIIAGLK